MTGDVTHLADIIRSIDEEFIGDDLVKELVVIAIDKSLDMLYLVDSRKKS